METITCKKWYLLLLFVASALGVNAQYVGNYSVNEELFNYSVKMPEEFVERFNDAPNSFIRQVYADEKRVFNLSRGQLLVTLFNMENQDFLKDTSKLGDFFRQVLQPSHPVTLSFLDSNWYAEARCIFLIYKKQYELPIILRVKTHNNEWAQWMIAGIGDTMRSKNKLADISLGVRGTDTFISTASHATNFLEFHDVFQKTIYEKYFFDTDALGSERVKAFISLVKKGVVSFQYVKSINYHYYQVPGWVFTTQYFDRKTKNSGWLINKMEQVPENKKSENIKYLLRL